MRTEAPALLPVFRSRTQADLLTWLYLHPHRQFSLSELARNVGATTPTLHREAQRLVEAGLLKDEHVGRNRMVSANPDHPAADALAQLLMVTFGPRFVVADEFRGMPGAEEVLVFGSWADRYDGRAGRFPNDVDVLVVGDVDRGDLYAAADRAQSRLGLDVNPVMRTRTEWENPEDPLSSEIRRRPMVVAA